jgi:hypothetical protein
VIDILLAVVFPKVLLSIVSVAPEPIFLTIVIVPVVFVPPIEIAPTVL